MWRFQGVGRKRLVEYVALCELEKIQAVHTQKKKIPQGPLFTLWRLARFLSHDGAQHSLFIAPNNLTSLSLSLSLSRSLSLSLCLCLSLSSCPSKGPVGMDTTGSPHIAHPSLVLIGGTGLCGRLCMLFPDECLCRYLWERIDHSATVGRCSQGTEHAHLKQLYIVH